MGSDRLDSLPDSQAYRFRQLGHIQCGGQVKVAKGSMTARRDALFLSIRHAPMNKMRPKGTCGNERLRFII
jgi:hypothetical protein